MDGDGDIDILTTSQNNTLTHGAANPSWTAAMPPIWAHNAHRQIWMVMATSTLFWQTFRNVLLYGMKTTVPQTLHGRRPPLTTIIPDYMRFMLPTWTMMATSISFQQICTTTSLRGTSRTEPEPGVTSRFTGASCTSHLPSNRLVH